MQHNENDVNTPVFTVTDDNRIPNDIHGTVNFQLPLYLLNRVCYSMSVQADEWNRHFGNTIARQDDTFPLSILVYDFEIALEESRI